MEIVSYFRNRRADFQICNFEIKMSLDCLRCGSKLCVAPTMHRVGECVLMKVKCNLTNHNLSASVQQAWWWWWGCNENERQHEIKAKLRLKVFNIHSTNHQLEDIIDLPLDWANHHYLHFLLWLVCLMQKLFTFYHKVATKNLSGEPIRPAVQCINRQSLIVNLESNVARIRIFCICIFVYLYICTSQSAIVNCKSGEQCGTDERPPGRDWNIGSFGDKPPISSLGLSHAKNTFAKLQKYFPIFQGGFVSSFTQVVLI